jgi:GT2 family glycosyltransferase
VYGSKLSRGAFATYYRAVAGAQRLAHLMGAPAASGSNMLISRRAFRSVGGFDTGLACNEDSELMWRVKRSGFRVAFAPDLEVYVHDHRRLERGVGKKTLHSVLRCGLLYFDLMPKAWREGDWGYWRPMRGSSGGSDQRPSTSS